MKKTKFTKIASVLTMLAMLLTLTAAFAVGASAEGTAQAQWGTDAANLTNEGTLQEALNAAGGDASITYIKLVSDIALGDSYVMANGGKFTLDLNGKTVTSTIYPFYVKDAVDITITDTSAEQTGKIESTGSGASAIATLDNSAINLTIAGGAFVGTTAIHTTHPTDRTTAINLTITGGTLQPTGRDHISWGSTGVLDLSAYGKYLNGVNIFNSTGSTITLPSEKIILPEGFDIYQNDEKATEMLYTYYYTVNGTYVEPETTPEETTSEPEETTSEPEETTSEPEETTSEPEETSSEEPAPEDPIPEEPTVEAQWGADAANLTSSGTLQEALDAAAADANVKYIKVINNLDLGDVYMEATGGTFTLDLNGRTVTSTDYTLHLYNFVNITITDSGEGGKIETTNPNASAIFVHDTTEINLTIEGGTLSSPNIVINAHSAFGAVLTVNLTIKGGTLQTAINEHIWWGSTGVLDLSDYANPTGITVNNLAGAEPNITLPAGYSFYDKKGNRVDGAFENGLYTINETKYKVTVNEAANGAVTADQSGDLTPGTVVALTLIPNEGYKADVTVTGATYNQETNTFVVESADVTVDVTFKLYQAEWGTDKDTLTEWGSLQDAFDAAYMNAGTVGYIKMMSDVPFESAHYAKGGTFTFDLNGKKFSTGGLFYIDGADVTITDTAGNGVIDGTDGTHAIALENGKLTLLGGELLGDWDVYWAGGELNLQSYPMLTEFVFYYACEELDLSDASILIPDGYSVYHSYDNLFEKVDRLESSCTYTVDTTKYKITVNETENGTVTADQSGYLTPGTVVALTLTPNEGYKADVTVDGATFDPQTNSFVVESSDVTVDVTFELYQAEWGTDAENLTEWGSLQDAFDAAYMNAGTVGYIKMMSDVAFDFVHFVTGGTFTFDLNGKTVTSTTHTLSVENNSVVTITDTVGGGVLECTTSGSYAIGIPDNANVQLTIAGGTVRNTSDGGYAIEARGTSVTVTGNAVVQGKINWFYGVLILSNCKNPMGIIVANYTGVEQPVELCEGYSFYNEYNSQVATNLANYNIYFVDQTQYQLSFNVNNGIDGANSSFSHSDGMWAWGTPVSFTLALRDHYELVSVALNGEALEPDAEGVYSFEMPEGDAVVVITTKPISFAWGTSADAMTSTGDFFDLVAAINAGEAPYAKLLADYEVELSESDVVVSGKSFIDLNGHLLEFYAPNGSKVVLGEGADITLFAEQKVDGANTYDYDVHGAFELQSGSKLTVSGAYLIGYISYNGGTLDISDAHLATYCELYNLTDAEITIADVVTFAAPFRAFDPAWYNDPNYEGYTVPTVTTLAARVENIASAYIEAVFTVTFDFGEGSGTMPTVEVSSGDLGRDIPTPEGLSHPEGLALIGWIYEGKEYDSIFANSFYTPELADITLTAKWGAPLYVGGVGMNDGDYLASGATETTAKRPTTGGYAYYKDGVLTLNNYQFTGEGFAYEYDGYYDEKYFALIYSATDLVIELVGNSNLVGTAIFYDEDHDYYFNADTDGVRVKGDLTVRGKGSLNIKVEDDGFYIEDLIFESGTVTIVSNDEAIESDNITVLDGALITVSEDGVDSDIVTVKGGEFYLLPEDDDDDVELDTQTLTVTGGKLVVKGCYGIYADYVTVSGGVVEVEAEYGAITPWDTEKEDGFVTISGGKVTLYSEYSDAIYSTGDVTVSGGEVILYGDYGIYADGNVTVTGGELEIEAYDDAIYAAGDVTISGGDIYTYSYSYNGISAYGNITISGGDVVISVGSNYAIEACGDETAVTINGGSVHLMGHILTNETTTVTFGGKATQLYIEGNIISTIPPVFTEGEIKHIFTVDGTSYYEGVEISHNWTDAYKTDETHHYRICTDEDCVVRYFYLPESYYQYFEGANYGEHTVPEGEVACSVCGYGAEVPEEEIPEDAVLLVGDHYLKIGEYLTFDSDGNPIVVTEKPATGGYLYATVGTIEDTPVITIVLSNFSFEYTGVAAIVALQDNVYIMQLEGENTITAHADNNYDVLYSGALTNGAGIAAVGSQLAIIGEGSLTINSEVGIFGFDSSFAVQNGATVTINAQQDGIEIQNGIFAVADATLTVNAGDDGIYISDGRVILAAASRVSVTSGDEGFLLDNVTFRATNATVTVVAVDDAIDADDCYIEWENSTFDLTADDHGITVYTESEVEYAFFVTDSILNIEAGDDGIRIYGYPEVFFAGSVLNITAEDAGLYFDSTRVMFASQLGMILSLNSTPGTSGNISEVNINAKRNYLSSVTVDVYEVKLNVVVTETAFALDYASLYFVGSEVSIVSRDMGIYGEYEADVNVYDSTLSIEAARYGINGYLYLDIRGEMVDISVRAFNAIYCDWISLDEDYDYMMNAIFDGSTFLDENDDIASYVTIRSYAAVNAEMEEVIENLDQLLSEGGEFDAIANSIADVNGLLDTLTNAEGEGRLDLIEKANEAINTALATLDQNLANAQTNLQNAIDTKADAETVNQSIADLNEALDNAEAAYAAADKAIDDKLTAAQTTLDTAIQAVDKKVDDAKTALEAAIKAGDDTLTAEIENLNKALEDAEAAYAAADKVISDDLTAAKTTLTTVQTRLDTAEKTITELQTAVESLKSLINADTGDVDLTEITAQINTINSKMEGLDELGLSAFKTSVTETLATLNESVSILNSTVAGIDSEQISSNKQAVEELNASLAEMKTELQTLDTLTAKDAELEGEIDAITGNIGTITNKLNDVDGKLAKLETTLAELEKIATGDHGTIDKIQQALADVNKALEDLQGIEDHTRLEALESAATRVDSTLKTIGDKLDTIDPADITENKSAIESLGTSLEELQATVTSLGTTDGTITESVQAMNTSLTTLSGKVTAAEARFVANESAINALQSAVAALEQANAANANLKTELNALKSQMDEKSEEKGSGWQTATTIIAIVGLVCNAGLIAALVIIESKKKILVPAFKSGFEKVASKFKKPAAGNNASQNDDNAGEE